MRNDKALTVVLGPTLAEVQEELRLCQQDAIALQSENELLRKSMSEALIETMLIASGFAGYALQLAPNDWRTDHILKRIKTVEQLLTPSVEFSTSQQREGKL